MILRIFLGLLLTGSAFGGLELRLVPTEARETRIAGEPVTVLVILKNSGDVEEEIGYDTKPVESRGFVLHVNELEYKSKAFFGFVNKQISRLLGRKKLQSGKVLDQTIDLNFLPLRHGKNIVWAEIGRAHV